MSPMSEAKRRSNARWNEKNMKERYDRIQIVVHKGKREVIQAAASAVDETMSGFIGKAIDERIERLQAPGGGAK